MPTKISVGLCKKQGLPDFGSIGASCNVEIELDVHALDGDPERFRQHVRRAYDACRESVEAELSRETTAEPDSNGRSSDSRHQTQNGSTSWNGTRRAATQSQIRAISAIAGRNRIDLAPLLDRFDVRRTEDLSISEASTLIDELKGQPAGNGGGQ